MAATVEARRLTEAHRLAQARIAAQTVLAMHAVWSLLDGDDLDGTFDRWLTAALPVIQGQRATSARLAANYVSTFKALELGATAPAAPIVLAETADVAAVTTSLLVTGPVRVKSAAARGVQTVTAMRTAEATSAGAAMRHVLGGSRDTITQTIAADRQARGWARATSGMPCAFCAMVASRGPVYRSESTASFDPHDHCHCEPEPVYRDDAAWPPGGARYRDLWNESTVGLSGSDAVNAFRRALAPG